MKSFTEIKDGMHIDWDLPIEMDDGLELRADIFRPIEEGTYPVLITYGPYAKGLPFQQGYPSAWDRICLLYTSPSPRDATLSRMPSSA